MRKKIVLDFAFTLSGGVVPYFKGMMKNISKVDKRNRYCVLLTDQGLDLIEDVEFSSNIELFIFPKLISNSYRLVWEQLELPKFLYKNKIDVLFCVNNRVPFRRTKTKKIFLLGTLGPFEKKYLLNFSLKERVQYKFLEYLIVQSLKKADHTIFESHYTKNLVRRKYGYRGRCSVNHHGKQDIKLNSYSSKNIAEVKNKYGLSKNYLLYVTYIRRYKNFERLIRVFSEARQSFNQDIEFVVAGPLAPVEPTTYLDTLRNLCAEYNLDESFKFIGMVEHNDLTPLSLGCFAYVFPSEFENLSYALVEALELGLPIITTTGTAMPETCEDAAIYFDPDNDQKLSECLIKMVNNEALRNSLKKKSINRSKYFRGIKQEIIYNAHIFDKINQI
tara:strand:- start:319 stop:1485 length:1167 start_codon:yes stop_codon:yes gene_type:complete